MAPPPLLAELPLKVVWVRVVTASVLLMMPPPTLLAELPLKVLFVAVSVPPLA
jgi:hypothetical protein